MEKLRALCTVLCTAFAGGGMTGGVEPDGETAVFLECLEKMNAGFISASGYLGCVSPLAPQAVGLVLDCGEMADVFSLLMPVVSVKTRAAMVLCSCDGNTARAAAATRLLDGSGSAVTVTDGGVVMTGGAAAGSFCADGADMYMQAGLLLSLPLIEGASEVSGVLPEVGDMAGELMARCGIELRRDGDMFTVTGAQRYIACDTMLPAKTFPTA